MHICAAGIRADGQKVQDFFYLQAWELVGMPYKMQQGRQWIRSVQQLQVPSVTDADRCWQMLTDADRCKVGCEIGRYSNYKCNELQMLTDADRYKVGCEIGWWSMHKCNELQMLTDAREAVK